MINAKGCQTVFQVDKENPAKIRMCGNESKTQLICIDASKNYDVSAYVVLDTGKIESQNTLKILGFYFVLVTGPTANEHVKNIGKKYSARPWSIRHLKRMGIAPASSLFLR